MPCQASWETSGGQVGQVPAALVFGGGGVTNMSAGKLKGVILAGCEEHGWSQKVFPKEALGAVA